MLRMHEQPVAIASWLIAVVGWLLWKTPRDFGFFRTRWSCALLALVLWEQEHIRLSRNSEWLLSHSHPAQDSFRYVRCMPFFQRLRSVRSRRNISTARSSTRCAIYSSPSYSTVTALVPIKVKRNK